MDVDQIAATLKDHVSTVQAAIEKVESTNAARNVYQSTGLGRVFDFFQGRATFFGIVFTVAGLVLAFTGKLTHEFLELVTVIQTLVFCHSWKEDIDNQRMARIEFEKKSTQKEQEEKH
jgi:hypothetical protein